MPKSELKTKHIYEYEGGYPLENGKRLTKEIAREIGIAMGLPPSSGDIGYDLDAVKVHYPEGGGYTKRINPYYTPYIHIDSPLPPMLVFLCSSLGEEGPKSSYTINLNTLKPTKNSPIQTLLPHYILYRLQ